VHVVGELDDLDVDAALLAEESKDEWRISAGHRGRRPHLIESVTAFSRGRLGVARASEPAR